MRERSAILLLVLAIFLVGCDLRQSITTATVTIPSGPSFVAMPLDSPEVIASSPDVFTTGSSVYSRLLSGPGATCSPESRVVFDNGDTSPFRPMPPLGQWRLLYQSTVNHELGSAAEVQWRCTGAGPATVAVEVVWNESVPETSED